MRWRREIAPSRRTRTGFLLLPKTIRGETRWLEWAAWTEVDYNLPTHFGWKAIAWDDSARSRAMKGE